jgi:hypothetical protein
MWRALVRSHDTSVPEGQLRALWAAFAAAAGGVPVPDGSGAGGAEEGGGEEAPFAAVVAAARALATADSLDPSSPTAASLQRYTAAQLRAHIAREGGGAVDYSGFARYFRATGGAVNLNVARGT